MSLLETFRGLERPVRESLSEIASPLHLSFAALLLARDRCSVPSMTAEHIVAALEAAGVAVSKKSIQRALARAGARVARESRHGEDTSYKLMLKGEREVAPLLQGGGLTILRVDGNTPRSSRAQLGSLLACMKGLVRICDPYFGVRTFDTLEHLEPGVQVQFLTAKLSDAGPKLQNALKDFLKERPLFELRVVPTGGPLHDRYVLAPSTLLLVGHGLKDIGSKESFVIQLDASWAPDLLTDMARGFDTRWAGAVPA